MAGRNAEPDLLAAVDAAISAFEEGLDGYQADLRAWTIKSQEDTSKRQLELEVQCEAKTNEFREREATIVEQRAALNESVQTFEQTKAEINDEAGQLKKRHAEIKQQQDQIAAAESEVGG